MRSIWLSLLLPLGAQAIPTIDRHKHTVCAMTLNSTNERQVFEELVRRFPDRYNPVVELTEFGDPSNWFQRACASGISCDQLVISGHFAAGFSGKRGFSLPLKRLEAAGCSKSCEGILNHPYEVFLFGCNTLAGKSKDHRTPGGYVEHLMDEGASRYGAEMTSVGRYGVGSDSFQNRIRRSFGTYEKQIYGFDSVGPSGATIDQHLRNYYRTHRLDANFDHLMTSRFLRSVDTMNLDLARTLEMTAFIQCGESQDTPTDRRMCGLLDPRVSVDQKLDLVVEALGSPQWDRFIPTIKDFFDAHPPSSMTPSQRAEFDALSRNQTIARQVRGLVQHTERLFVQLEWIHFARHLKYLSPEQEKLFVTQRLVLMLNGDLTEGDTNLICEKREELRPLYAPRVPVPARPANRRALACLTP